MLPIPVQQTCLISIKRKKTANKDKDNEKESKDRHHTFSKYVLSLRSELSSSLSSANVWNVKNINTWTKSTNKIA